MFTSAYHYLKKITQSRRLSWLDYLILLFFIGITLYYGYASYALENMNEGLYAEIAREMLVTGNYLIPHLNFVPYLEKPPLLYWLIALSYHGLGVSALSARLVPVTMGAVTVLAVVFFGQKISQARVGWIAAIMLTTSIGFILISRVIIFDMLLTAVFSLSLIFFYLWYVQQRRFYLWFCYAFLALAFLTKGLLAVLLIPSIILLFLLWQRESFRKILTTLDWIGIGIFLLIVLPWVILATLKQTGFAWDFFINEQVLRFLNKRIPHDYHHGPFYYYFPALVVIALPWSFFLPLFLKKQKFDSQAAALNKFLGLWFLLPLIFFSLSQAKAQYYIIIAVPALMLLLAQRIDHFIWQKHNKFFCYYLLGLSLLITLLLAFICLNFSATSFGNFLPENFEKLFFLAKPFLYLCIFMLFYTVITVSLSFYTRSNYLTFILIAALVLPWIQFLKIDKQALQDKRSMIAFAQFILQHDRVRSVYLYQDYETLSTLTFYLQRRLPIIASQSLDLYFGSKTPEAKGWFLPSAEFIIQASHKPTYVVIYKDELKDFVAAVKPLEFCPVMQNEDILLLTNNLQECTP